MRRLHNIKYFTDRYNAATVYNTIQSVLFTCASPKLRQCSGQNICEIKRLDPPPPPPPPPPPLPIPALVAPTLASPPPIIAATGGAKQNLPTVYTVDSLSACVETSQLLDDLPKMLWPNVCSHQAYVCAPGQLTRPLLLLLCQTSVTFGY